MAKTKTSESKAKKKPNTKAKTKKAKTGAKSGRAQSSFDAVAKLAEHPIVADLIAIGATAAVTAIAAGMSSRSGKTSSKAVKDAGKAAAAAIGARLMTEFQAVKESAAASKAKNANPKKA
ncbi:MAG: hypothetical protein V4696_05865 [Pseudomonadota bacterium]